MAERLVCNERAMGSNPIRSMHRDQKMDETWKLVRAYECPKCGELVRDMMDACSHTCKRKKYKSPDTSMAEAVIITPEM